MNLDIQIIVVILVIVMLSTAVCDAKPIKKSENNSEKQFAVRIDRGGGRFIESLPFIGTSIALSLGKKLQRYGLDILVGPMLRVVHFLHKIHRFFN